MEKQTMEEITIIVVDDHPLFRQGVADVFASEPGFQVIGQADSGEEALIIIRDQQPKIAVLDVNLPGINGQQLMRQIHAEKLPTRVILLTAYDEPAQLVYAMRGGAAAYCSKEIRPDKLVWIIREAAMDKFIVGDQVLDASGLEIWLSTHFEAASRAPDGIRDSFAPLSVREMEVLYYLTKGTSNKQIALLLGISHQTVKNHVTVILRKLNVEDRTQAALYALRQGWVRLYQELQNQEGKS